MSFNPTLLIAQKLYLWSIDNVNTINVLIKENNYFKNRIQMLCT